MVNVLAPIRANESGSYLQTTFYPLAYYRQFIGTKLLECKIDIPELDGGKAGMLPSVSATATLCEDGSIALALVNISKDKAFTFNISGNYKIVEITEISCESFQTKNSFESPNNVKVTSANPSELQNGYTLPSSAISLLKLKNI